MRPSRNIVVCCDGTGNSFDNLVDDSNVVKLYTSLTIDDSQIGYYHPGVGTMGAPNSLCRLGRWSSKVLGLVWGVGLLANVSDAYRYLMDNYADGDRIYLFGFSRGAFTVRALASLIHVYGLLCAGNHGAIPYIVRMYAQRSREAAHNQTTFESNEAFKWQFSHKSDVKVHFCGLWDTVSAYGWLFRDPVELPFLGNNPIIQTGRHAISIDERRCLFQDNLWGQSRGDQDIRQVWFSGVHSDIGGSYPEPSSGLSKIALEWMLIEALSAGLCINKDKVAVVLGREVNLPEIRGVPNFVAPSNTAKIHKSLHGLWWWLLEFLPHRDPHKYAQGWYIPKGRRRTIPPDSYIHESVLTSPWQPKNLPKHFVEPWLRY